MEKTKKKKIALFIVLGAVLSLALIYCGTYHYYKKYVWMPHLPDESMIDYIDETKSRTYYYLKMEDIRYQYCISFPTLYGFLGSNCVFDVVSSIQDDDEHVRINENGEKEYYESPSDSKFAFTLAGRLNLKGKVKLFNCVVNAIPPEENCAAAAYFSLSPDLKLKNEDELSEAEKNLFQQAYPEMKTLCDNMYHIFSLE